MSGDVAMSGAQVHEAAREVLRFWFKETAPEQRFAKDAAFDATIRERFGPLLDRIKATRAAGWAERPETLLAAVIVLDQFSRNLFRGSAEAFAADPIARALTRTAMRNGWDSGMSGDERAFLYLPLEHSENAQDQADSVAAMRAIGIPLYVDYAVQHRDVIARFGRFPSRNAALGRTSTAEEEAYLSQPGAGW